MAEEKKASQKLVRELRDELYGVRTRLHDAISGLVKAHGGSIDTSDDRNDTIYVWLVDDVTENAAWEYKVTRVYIDDDTLKVSIERLIDGCTEEVDVLGDDFFLTLDAIFRIAESINEYV